MAVVTRWRWTALWTRTSSSCTEQREDEGFLCRWDAPQVYLQPLTCKLLLVISFSSEFNSSSLRRNSEVSCTFNVALLSFIFNISLCLSLLEARLLSHQTPVGHRGSCDPIGRSAAWNRCRRGHHPADSQSESATDTAGERASDISQRLGSSRCDAHWSLLKGQVHHGKCGIECFWTATA